jgi:hypothetical protein
MWQVPNLREKDALTTLLLTRSGTDKPASLGAAENSTRGDSAVHR